MNYINPIYIGYTIQRVNLSLVNLLEKIQNSKQPIFPKQPCINPQFKTHSIFHIPYSNSEKKEYPNSSSAVLFFLQEELRDCEVLLCYLFVSKII